MAARRIGRNASEVPGNPTASARTPQTVSGEAAYEYKAPSAMIVPMPPLPNEDATARPPRPPGRLPPVRPGGRTRPNRPRGLGRRPLVCYALIAACTAVFLVSPVCGLLVRGHGVHGQLCAQAAYFDRWGVIPGQLLHERTPLTAPAGCPLPDPHGKVPALSVLTALFVHGGWLHLLGNMLFLYVFGPAVEERLGRAGFAVFYLAAGYAATYGYALGRPGSAQTLVGASGAIAGVLGAYLYFFPRARVTGVFPFLLFLPLRFPAWLVLGFWFGLQALAARTEGTGPGIAYPAHLVGFGFGLLCAACLGRSRTGRRAPAGLS